VQVADMQMSFGLSWYSASCFDIFSRAFAGATVARIKRADMPAIMPQTSLRRPTLIDRLVTVFSQFSSHYPLSAWLQGFLHAVQIASPLPVTIFKCCNLTQ
jgi:hypothetical protein